MRKVGFGAVSVALVLGVAACGSSSSGGTASPGGGSTKQNATIVLGTTDTIVSADPAGSYDLPSWTVQYNVFQTLLQVPPGTSDIAPEAANCDFHGKTSYVCNLVPGQMFSNGDPVTGDDVVFSIKRVLAINSPNGPASVFAAMKAVPASGTAGNCARE